MYVYDCNKIMKTPMKNRSDKEMIRYFVELTAYLKICGFNPGFHIMDNETWTVFKKSMSTMDIKYQLVPPSNHRVKNPYRSIQTFKNHLIALILGVDSAFHLQLLCRMLQRAIISLNIVRQSRLYPHLLVYTHFYGDFDCNHTPLAPPVGKVVIHNKSVDT